MSPETLVVRHGVTPNPRQHEFSRLCDTAPAQSHIGYGGAIRTGKSQAGAGKLVGWAYQHGGDYVVSRKTYRRLEDSTKAVFLRGDGGLPPAIPYDFFRTGVADYQVGENQIVGEGQGGGFKIMFRSLEQPKEAIDLIKNITLAGYMIDQIEELDDDAYEELYDTFQGRLSHPSGPRKGIGISNPGPEDHWYHRRVVDEATKDKRAFYVHTTLHDNAANLDPEYVASMMETEQTKPDWFNRFILGKWGAFGGKRFKCWNPEIHLVDPFPIPPEWTVIEGIDYGWAHYLVYLVVALDPFNRLYVFGEIAVRETPVSVVAKRIKEMRRDLNYSPSATWLDPNAWTTRAQFASPAMEFMEHGIHVGEAQNDRLGGWNRIEELLTEIVPDPDKPEDRKLARPQMTVMRGRAPQLVKELPNLRIKDGTDDVEKKNDDAADTLRYIINSYTVPPPVPPKSREDEHLERKLREARGEEDEDYDLLMLR